MADPDVATEEDYKYRSQHFHSSYCKFFPAVWSAGISYSDPHTGRGPSSLLKRKSKSPIFP